MIGLDALLNRRPPSAWERFASSPIDFLAQSVYAWSARFAYLPQPKGNPIRVVCISDTHNTHRNQPALPPGDILVHAGDLTHSGTPEELEDALTWLAEQPHTHKIFIAGNHDTALANEVVRNDLMKSYTGLTYLQDSYVEVSVRTRTLRIHGSPHTPKHGSWPFQYPRISPGTLHNGEETEAHKIWSAIPPATDVLVTHGPPIFHRDLGKAGCIELLRALWRVRPRLHVCGHIHGGRGVEELRWGRAQRTYEEVCAGRRGWTGLVVLFWWAVVEQLGAIWRGEELSGTMLVNAAAVGGVRDDKRLGALVVEI